MVFGRRLCVDGLFEAREGKDESREDSSSDGDEMKAIASLKKRVNL